jgi:parallel beta-helix repeat protein
MKALRFVALVFGTFLVACGTPNARDETGTALEGGRPSSLRASAVGTGLSAEYFDTQDFSGTPVKRLDPTVNFEWGLGAPAPGIAPDTFSVRHSGEILAPSTGVYTFYATSDDGVRLTVRGLKVLEDFSDHGPYALAGTVSLVAGQRVPVKLEYYENGGGATLRLEWSGPGVTRGVVPTSNLFVPTPVVIPTGKTYIIAPTGNDQNPGSEALPWLTIHKAVGTLAPGDTVLVKTGTYLGGWYVQRSGAPGKPITYRAYPGASPVVRVNEATSGAFLEGVSYVTIDGFDFDYVTPGAQAANGARGEGGIMIQDSPNGTHAHHIAILNNKVHNFPGGGIGSNLSDYLTIQGNTVWANALWSWYDGSGISLYRNLNVDTAPGYHNIIRGNLVFANENRVPDIKNKVITDGNCIIIDDARNTQHEVNDPLKNRRYTSATLIENNICAGNGARGVHVYSSDNVLARHNTLFKNQITATINDGELSAYDASNVRFVNNIVYTLPGKRATGIGNATNIVYERNLYFNTTNIPNKSVTDLIGDPLFEGSGAVPTAANFRLRVGSPAVDKALAGNSPTIDFGGRARPLGLGSDLGAWEVR